MRELEYAIDLNRHVIPIRHDDTVDVGLWPPELSQLEFIDYASADPPARRVLARTLSKIVCSPKNPKKMEENVEVLGH